ncbi:MAG: OsmC family protein [Bacteroidetes bacterium]|nr:OsmC family protein [Bacteroidota bacterium]
MRTHSYTSQITWTGNRGTGTSRYDAYDRSHLWEVEGKQPVQCSSDTPFRGDGSLHNPEDMLLASLSSCHMLWYLHLCADAGIVVTYYQDRASGDMTEVPGGGGYFEKVILHPVVTITDPGRIADALALHDAAHSKCFIANSVKFPVLHVPEVRIA